jgi:HSP20 family protein
MDRLFERFIEPRWDEADTMTDWWPRMDLAETKDAFVMKVEVPGVDQKDIHVSLQEQTLTVKGEKRQEKEDKDEHYHRVERAYGTFTRSFRLPATVEGAGVKAEFKDGLLTITLPKTPAAKATTIPVKAM